MAGLGTCPTIHLISAEDSSALWTHPLVVTPSLVVARSLVHLSKSKNLSVTESLAVTLLDLVQLRPVRPDTSNTSKLGFAIYGVDGKFGKVPLEALVCGYCPGRQYTLGPTNSDQQVSDGGDWLRNCSFVEDVGGSKAFIALGGEITAIGQDGRNLIVEVVFRLVCTSGRMSPVT